MGPEGTHTADVDAPPGPAAFLWDMDGTIVDTEPHWIAAERDLVASYGNEWPDHHAHALIGFDLLTAGAYIAEHGPVPLSPAEIVDTLLDGVVARIVDGVEWRPGARELLAEARAAAIPCALVTMSWTRFAAPIIDRLPAGTFDAVVTGDTVRHGKPHPEPYLQAARALGVDPSDCVALEDSPTGVTSAAAAGCRVLAVPMMPPLEVDHPVTVVESLVDIDLAWVRRWWGSGDSGSGDLVNNRC